MLDKVDRMSHNDDDMPESQLVFGSLEVGFNIWDDLSPPRTHVKVWLYLPKSRLKSVETDEIVQDQHQELWINSFIATLVPSIQSISPLSSIFFMIYR